MVGYCTASPPLTFRCTSLSLACFFFFSPKFDLATKELFTAVTRIDAENLEATMHLGSCQQRLGRHHEALDAFLKASRLEPENPEIYELLLSAVGQARTATGIGNPGVGEDPVGEARSATGVENPGVGDDGQDPEGTGAVGAGEAKGEGGSPAAVLEAGQAGRGVKRSSGRVVKPPPEHGAEGDNLAGGGHSALSSRDGSVVEGGDGHGGQDSDEGATAVVAGSELQEAVPMDVAGVSGLGDDARSGGADAASPGGANEDQDRRHGADATGGGGGGGGGGKGDGRGDAAGVDFDVAGVPGPAIDAKSGRTDTEGSSGLVEGVNEESDQDGGAIASAGSAAGTEMADADVAGASSLGVDVRSGTSSGAGSVSTKASPEVAGASVREAAAAMRKRSDSLSQSDMPETPPRGFFVPRERHDDDDDAQDDPKDATGADGAPTTTADGAPATSDGTPATADGTLATADGTPPATVESRDGGVELSGTDAIAERASLKTVDLSAMADGEAAVATPADDKNAGGEEVGAGELVLPGGSTAVLPGGGPAAGNVVTPVAGTSVGHDSDPESEGGTRQEEEEEEETGRVAVGVSAHSDMEEKPLAKTGARVTDDSEAVSPAVTDEPESVVGESVVDSSEASSEDGNYSEVSSEGSSEISSEVSSEVAEAASAGALAAEKSNGREDGVPPERVPPVEGLEEDVMRGKSQISTTKVEDGSENPADIGDIASSTGAPETSGEANAITKEKGDIAPTEGIPVSGHASESPGDALEPPGGTADGQTAHPAGGGGAEQAEAVNPSVTAAPANLEAPDGADGSSTTEDTIDVPGKISNNSSSATSPGAASETPEDGPVPVVTDAGGAEEEGGGTASGILEANDGSAVAEQEAVSVGGSQGGDVEGGGPDGNPLVAGSSGETDVAGASDGGGAGVGAAADVGAAVAGDVETGDAAAAVTAVSEEEGRRARSKAKLGLARFQKGQTQKAVLMFEKAASIDPGWWGGFYYTALARDSLGNTEAAAHALVSALSVDAPTEASEVAELTALASKVLASLNGDKAGLLKAAMDASSLTFAAAQAIPESVASAPNSGNPPLPGGSTPGGNIHDPASPGPGGAGGGVGRATSMRDRAQGAGPGLEADLAHLGKAAKEDIDPSLPVGGGLENAKKDRWPFSGKGGPAAPSATGGVSASRGGEAGSIPGSNRGAIPGMPRGEASPPAPVPVRNDDLRGVQGSDRIGRRENGDAQAHPDAGRRRGWGRTVGPGNGGGNGEAQQPSQNHGGGGGGGGGGSAAGRGGSGSNGGVGSAAIDSKASAEEILASMGLKSGLSLGPDGVTGGVAAAAATPVGAKTPAEMMAESRGGGGGGGGSSGGNGQDAGDGGKRGLFGRLWKGKGKER